MNLLNDFLPQVDFKSYEDFMANYKVNCKEDFNFGFDVVDKYAELDPNKLAVVWCNDSGEEKFISFKEISDNSTRIANMLIKSGIQKGDHVLIMLMSRYEYWYTVIALHKIAAIPIPATSQLTYKDIEYRCNSAAIKAIITVSVPGVIEHINKARPKCKTLKNVFSIGDAENCKNFWNEVGVDSSMVLTEKRKTVKSDPMIAYFTSGTTGLPKMVTHCFTYPLSHILTAHIWHQCKDGGIHFTAADTGWAKASWGKLYGQWICGTAVFAYDYYGKYSPLDLLPLLEKYKVTSFCAPPTMYRFFMKEEIATKSLSNIEHFCTAGEPLNPVVYESLLKLTRKPIFEGYGQTETVLSLGTFPFMNPRPGSMGKPSPQFDLHLLDENSNPVEDNCEGEICIKLKENQIGLFIGYHNDEGRMRNVWRDGYYHTGDVAIRDSDGFYWFVGRDDDIIKSSGYRIGPFEVESALLEHPSVMECAITAVPDDVRGQIIKATIVLARNYFPSDSLKKELQDHVKHTTAPYKYPRIIEFVNRLPKTLSDKIRRNEIRETDRQKD